MARAAGGAGAYRVAVLNTQGVPVYEVKLRSVTTVLGRVVNKSGPLSGWAYKTAIEGAVALASQGDDIAKLGVDGLKRRLKEERLSIYNLRDDAAGRGTAAHAVAEMRGIGDKVALTRLDNVPVTGNERAKELLDEMPGEVRGYGEAANAWFDDEQPELLANEMTVVRLGGFPKLAYAGTLDAVEQASDHITLVDYKTSKRIYDEALIQTAAYGAAYTEMTGKEVRELKVVRFGERGDYEVRSVSGDDIADLLEAWELMLRLDYKLTNGG